MCVYNAFRIALYGSRSTGSPEGPLTLSAFSAKYLRLLAKPEVVPQCVTLSQVFQRCDLDKHHLLTCTAGAA